MGEKKKRPQVFISFRGKDERQKLLAHLKHHLKDRNVNVFTDEDACGEQVEKIFKYIRRSRIVIVIFSINYLGSHWCLDELVQIKKCLECKKVDFAIPIFYKVETSDVKKLSGKFGKKFVTLQETHSNSKVKKWKKALRYVAKSIGLTYEKRSSISELEFIKKIVERVDFTLTKIASKDKNSQETSKGEASNLTDVNHLNKMLHLSTALESQNLEKAIDRLAHMMYEQAHPALIFSNWDEFDDYTKNNIIDSARKKAQMLRVYNRGVESRHFLSTNFAPSFEVPTCYRLLKPNVSQESRRSISYHNNINQYHALPSLNLECSNVQGFMLDAARKDVTIPSMVSSSFRIPLPENPLQFRGYNWGVGSTPFLPTKLEPIVPQYYRESIPYHNNINRYHPSPYGFNPSTTIHHPPHLDYSVSWSKSTDEMGFNHSTTIPHRPHLDYSVSGSWRDAQDDIQIVGSWRDAQDDLLVECGMPFDSDTDSASGEEISKPPQPRKPCLMLPTSDNAAEPEDKTNCISVLCYYFKRCFSLKWGAKEDDED